MMQPNRLPLAMLPTPLVSLQRLSEALGGATILMKRDDLTGMEVSGNKVRKLEYVVAEALAKGCDTLVTEGGPQSNHCRAVAAVSARLGLHSVLLVRPEAGAVQANRLLSVLFGAESRLYDRPTYMAQREEIVAGVLDELRAAGRRPYWIPLGASDPLGCWGYIQAATELAEQLKVQGTPECDIVLAISSGGTYAGFLLGVLLSGMTGCDTWAVPVSDDVAHHTAVAGDLCRTAIDRYDLPIEFDETLFRFIDGYVGEGYAVPYREEVEAVRLVARTEGIVLDPVYTGKAFCAMLDQVRQKRFGFHRPVVFIHTGGIFTNFTEPDLLLETGDLPNLSRK